MKPGRHSNTRSKSGHVFILFLALCLVLMLPATALGQNENTVTLSTPDLSQFPLITVFFWPVNANGEFIQDLPPSDVKVLENDRQVAIGNLERIEPGIHFVVAVNEGPTLANRYAGVVRFDTLKQALTDWIGTQSSATSSDFSLVNNAGSVQSNLANPADWLKVLQDYQPDLRAASPGMTSLSTGIDTAGSDSGSTTRTRAMLYITPLPEDAQLTGIQDASKRAVELGVRLFIWLIGPQNYSATEAAMVLQKAATDTGGSFFLFSGSETLPEITSYLNPLKYVYQLSYITSIKSSGDFELALQVKSGGSTLTSNTVPLNLKVLPPNPILLSPPVTLHRTWTAEDGQALSLSPINTEIKILLEFPDGHARSLAYSRLFIDGRLESENTSPPFDTFGWDLSGYTSSETHMLQVTIEDQIGLTNQTIEIPVDIQVDAMPRTRLQKVLDWFTPLRAVWVGLLAAALAAVVVILVRKSRFSAGLKKKSRRANDPITQPVELRQEKLAPAPGNGEPENWPIGQGGEPAAARLRVCDTDSLQPLPGEGYALTKEETIIGSNARKADITLSHESVSEVHAFLFKQGEGGYRLQDAGSAAGTWVNYAPVPVAAAARTIGTNPAGAAPANETGGIFLEHGDLIHIGRVPLVFEIYKPTPPKIRVVSMGDLE